MSLLQSLLEESGSGVSPLGARTDRSQGSQEPLLRAWDASTAMPSCDKRTSMQDGQSPVRDCQSDWQHRRQEWAHAHLDRSIGQEQDHQKQKQHRHSKAVPALTNSGISLRRQVLGMVLLQACFQILQFEAFLMFPALHKHTQVCMVSMLLSTVAVFLWLTRQTIVMPLQQARDAVLRPFQPVAEMLKEKVGLSTNCVTEATQVLAVGMRLDVMRETLARFMPAQIVQEVFDCSINSVLTKAQDVSVMFCDIRGFTTIAEVLDPDSLLLFLNRYLSVMVRVLRLYDGTVAEIYGDGILAFWNAERHVRDHAEKAVAALVAMIQALTILNEEMSLQNLPSIEIGIGIHKGEALTGIIGCNEKLKWGCLGDTVNLASRLEGLCKHYRTSIICSEAMKVSLSEDSQICTRRLDTLKVRGREALLEIYDVWAQTTCR
eukprot:TRINITY_DN13017_c0_g1_i1.p1 TRINITY_DN13017_c0_g1~~TRINITY_DN13017_c0_g1_i1.p1  ORF type:complete len:433 (+),score=71.01 TRINITY_DN13017_c0_g1_i1:105-1403(+)